MQLKTDAPQFDLTIDTEESLDNCIKLLESSHNFRSCTLHFTINDLPSQKITRLADLLKIQTKLDTLALTADLSLDSSEQYASILEKVFTELSLLRSLTFRGLFSDNLPSDIDKTNYSGRRILELLDEHKALEEIRVDGIEITPNKFAYSFSRAERLDLACKYLSKVLTVRHLELSLPALGSTADQYQLLALTINNLPHLQELKLSGLSSQGFQILCQQSLIKPSALTDLTLTGVSNLTEESALNLIALIKSNTHLTSLTFCLSFGADKYWIGNELGAELGKALGQNRNLTYFKLNRTKLNDPEIIAGIIANNTSLQVLDLENNGFCFDESGVESILNSLNYNKTLSTLNVCSNLLTFPIILNPKFHLINFQILNDTTALEDYPGAQRNNSDFRLENKIQPEIYRLITDRVEENKKWRIIQKYLLLQHLGTQTYPLNTDLINLIFLCTLGRFELQAMAYRIENSKKISIDRNLIEPTLSTIENMPSDEHVELHVMDEKKPKKIPFDKQILLSPEQISAMKIDEDGFSADYPDSYFDFVYQECLSKQYSIIRCKKEEASNFRPVEFPYHTQILISSERFNALKRDEDGFSTVYPDSHFDHIYQEVESQKQAIIHYKKEYVLPEIMSRKRGKEKWKKELEQRRKEGANIPQRPVQERFEEALQRHQLQKIEIKKGALEVMLLENVTEQPAKMNKTSVTSQPLPPQKVVNPSSKITKKPNQEMDIALANLKKHIDELEQHGRKLTAFSFDKDKGTYDPYSKEFIKGTHIATLVHDLNRALKTFNKSMTKASFKTLSERFTKALNENQDGLQTHRDEWVPFAVFAGNILISLSIIGALFFAGKAIYASTTREGLSLHSVFVGMRTASEKKALEIESDLEQIALRL